MNQNSENKQFMYGDDYRHALTGYLETLSALEQQDLLFDFIFDYMKNHMTNEQVQQFIDTGEW